MFLKKQGFWKRVYIYIYIYLFIYLLRWLDNAIQDFLMANPF